MGLNVGNVPVTAVYVGSTPVTAVYVGAEKIWPTTDVVQITLGAGTQARDQLRAALTARGLSYQTVTEIPFEIELVGTGSAEQMFYYCQSLTSVPDMDTSQVTNMLNMFRDCPVLTSVPDMDTSSVTNMSYMFRGCSSLTSVPDMDTGQVTDMSYMFRECAALTSVPDMDTGSVTDMQHMFFNCASLTHVPDLDTSQVTNTRYMFWNCASLTDGNVRLIGRHPQVDTTGMIGGSGLTREPFYTTDGQPWPTAEVHEVTLTQVVGANVAHPLTTLTIPEGQTWQVRIQGQITEASGSTVYFPFFRIGAVDGPRQGVGPVDFSGTVTSANPNVSLVTVNVASRTAVTFTGTVTIEK